VNATLDAGRTWRAIWRWHFHAGLFCIPVVLVLALSGGIYLFKPQLDAFADRAVDSLQVTGAAASAPAQIEAALGAVPGSKLFSYEVPLERDDAVRVHVYSADGSGRIVYVHPQTLAVLKIVPHTARFTEFVRTLHGELLAGTAGSLLVELVACWAIVMLVTGIYLWWPRNAQGLAGVLWPRLRSGPALFWRDLHAVIGIWVAVFALFLLITALPWTTVWGKGFTELRKLGESARADWSQGRAAEHAEHLADAAAASATPAPGFDDIVAHARGLALTPPVRVYPPSATVAHWRIRSETQNRVRVVDVALDARTGAEISRRDFADRGALDRVIGIGISAHEGQLFGRANQLLGLATALGIVTLCISGLVMWWRSRKTASWGVPAPAVAGFRISRPLVAVIITLGVLLPLFGAAVLLLVLVAFVRTRFGGDASVGRNAAI
jgi:uncharacterized iron-regulated membrane protein